MPRPTRSDGGWGAASSSRASAVGSIQNRLNCAINLARNPVVNNRAAASRIRDTNIATESAQLTRFSILNQIGLAGLAQANASSSMVLSL